MNTIKNYLLELKKELLILNGDEGSLDEYSSHITESFDAFRKKKETSGLNDEQLEDVFVQQLEPVKRIAKSLLGFETNYSENTGKIGIGASDALKIMSSNLLKDISIKTESFRKSYLKHRSPPLTALVYILYSITILFSFTILGLFLPEVSSISCNGGSSVIHIGDPYSYECPPTSDGYGSWNVSPFKFIILMLFALVVIFILLIQFAYKSSIKYSLLTAICLSLYLIPIFYFVVTTSLLNNSIFTYDLRRMPGYLLTSWYGVSNWHMMNVLSINELVNILFFTMVSRVFLYKFLKMLLCF
jgi:hypothetical protein